MRPATTTMRNGQLGFWMADTIGIQRSYPRFEGDETVDLAIIGGGYSGLWAAYFAKTMEPSMSVAVFEAERLGYGASGRNGGWVSALVPGNRMKFAKASATGKAASVALQREFITSVDTLLEILATEGIEADQYKGGTLSAAHTEAGLNRLIAKRASDLSYGMAEDEVQLLGREEFQTRIKIEDVHGGLFYKDVARMNPAKLLMGLADTVSRMGVKIYEDSRVLAASEGTLKLDAGRANSKRTFICTEGYSGPPTRQTPAHPD
ncbi:NAD(P)/FAD-dependent oxidoreductase [Arthrobacter sp. S2(2024)]|uniref:NAD(P)/FAD-dependent oxidoreductase n=1 Tax=Arthrobacter sp. S2(2024) TaxID=3111911 RepID=UPI002FC6862E